MLRILLAFVLLFPALAFAQRTIDFSAQTTTGDGEVTPVLTWNTTPPADSCIASGQWDGEKGSSGTETLAPITTSATFNLTCTWQGDSIATFSWINATENQDGSPYTDVGTTRIAWSFEGQERVFDPCAVRCVEVPHSQTMRTVTGITEVGTMEAAAVHVNARGVLGAISNVATKVFTGAVTSTESVGIVVNPLPAAPAAFEIQ